VRLGLIARADSRGLGVQTKAVYDHLNPAKTLVVDCPSAMPLPIRRDWYPDGTWVKGLPRAQEFNQFLEGLDAVYTAETAYSTDFWGIAEKHGVRTVLAANYEFLNVQDRPTVWAAPSLWNIDHWPTGTIHLPVPIETNRFGTPNLPATATNLLHVVGRPTLDRNRDLHRNGTIDLLMALQHVTAEITVTVRCQMSGYVGGLINEHHLHTPSNVTLKIESGDTPNYWDMYTDQHALILPRRWGGLCLPANEALGAGIPVIMTDIDPNNTWLPAEWLVPAKRAGEFRAKQLITSHQADPIMLAAKIDQLATDATFYDAAKTQAAELREQLSWDSLRERYKEVLAG